MIKKELTYKKILVVEDDYYNSLILEEYLKKLNSEIITVKDGIQAIDAIKTDPEIALILMDLKLPHMSGIEAAKQIKGINKDVIIIIQTAMTINQDISLGKGIWFDDYISKPYTKEDLLKLIVPRQVDNTTSIQKNIN